MRSQKSLNQWFELELPVSCSINQQEISNENIGNDDEYKLWSFGIHLFFFYLEVNHRTPCMRAAEEDTVLIDFVLFIFFSFIWC